MSDLSDRSLRVAMTGIVHDDDPTIIADMMVGIETLAEALRDLMARFALDSEEECRDVSERLGIQDVDALWGAAQRAQAALDATSQ